MPTRTRKRLPSTKELGPIAQRVIEANKFLSDYPLPRLLNRRRWTKKQWKRHKESWAELDQEKREKQRQHA
ncbi:hypothetical protein LCGC14_2764070, partial [marine sediment metagenome]